MKTFILLSAIAGAGKSTWAEQYRLTHKNVVIVSSDAIRYELTGQYQDLSKEKEVWERFSLYIQKGFDSGDDVTVIADSTNTYNFFRKVYADETKKFDKRVLVVIRKPLDLILKQNKQRSPNKVVPEKVIHYMWDHWEEPTKEVIDMFDEYIEIDGWFDSSKVKKSFHYEG